MSEKFSVMWMVHFNNAQSVSLHRSNFQPTCSQAQILTQITAKLCSNCTTQVPKCFRHFPMYLRTGRYFVNLWSEICPQFPIQLILISGVKSAYFLLPVRVVNDGLGFILFYFSFILLFQFFLYFIFGFHFHFSLFWTQVMIVT